jgi:hypothetical protein
VLFVAAEQRDRVPVREVVVKCAGLYRSMPVQTTATEPDVHRSEHTQRPATTPRALGRAHVLAERRHRSRLLDIGAAMVAAVQVGRHSSPPFSTKPATKFPRKATRPRHLS